VLLLIVIPWVSGAAEETEIRVRLIDAHSGKPYVDRDVQVFGTNTPSGLPGKDVLFHLQRKTGADGLAHFQMAPRYLTGLF
jgi:hypothetical protein